MSNLHNIQPGTVLAVEAGDLWRMSSIPQITHDLYTVSRTTATQAIAVGKDGEIRVRLKDLGVVGEVYARAVIATDEIQAKHAAQVDERKRWRAARDATADLIGKELHQLKLTTAQLEALAEAWKHIKEMK